MLCRRTHYSISGVHLKITHHFRCCGLPQSADGTTVPIGSFLNLECPMGKAFFAPSLIAATCAIFGSSAPVSSAVAANLMMPLPKVASEVLPVNHRRYWWPGYYPYYSYPAYSYYTPYYGPPAVAYPPPVVYYPGPRYYPGPAEYGAYGGFVVRRPYGSYYTDW